MSTVAAVTVMPSMLRSPSASHHHYQQRGPFCIFKALPRKNQAFLPVMRLFGPAIFEASKLKVVFVGVDEKKHPWKLPRTYTLTHSDVTSMLTLGISETINNSQLQGWYNRLQRDEVVAEWRNVKGKMSLHVHCHISGGHFLLNLVAKLRYYIFCKELPVVLKAFIHGDRCLFDNYPDLQDAMVWVYFHSNLAEYNTVECWGPLYNAAGPIGWDVNAEGSHEDQEITSIANTFKIPKLCREACRCCFPRASSIPWSQDHHKDTDPMPKHSLQQQS